MIKLLRDAQAFVGKSRCSVGHSVSEVQDRAKTRSCIYCEQQFALYEALGRAIVVADEPSPPHEWETVDGKPLHCATCQCAELERAGFVDPTPPHLMAQGYRSGHVFSTHWSNDPCLPYAGCECSSCEDARDRGMVEAK